MALLDQSSFPRLWRAFQFYLGGNGDKCRLALRHYTGQAEVLEVGCSLGNIASAFVRCAGVRYTGVDIDPVAVAHGRRVFRARANFEFICADLTRTNLDGRRFGFVLVAGVCHHIDDLNCEGLLDAAAHRLSPGGTMVVTDPLLPRREDPWLVRQFYRLDRGGFFREGPAFLRLVRSRPGLRLVRHTEDLIGAMPGGWPRVARFGTYVLRPA